MSWLLSALDGYCAWQFTGVEEIWDGWKHPACMCISALAHGVCAHLAFDRP